MDTLPAKPPSSRNGHDHDRDRDKRRTKKNDKHRQRSRQHDRDGDTDKDRDRNHDHRDRRRRHRSPSPTRPPKKRSRVEHNHNNKDGVKTKRKGKAAETTPSDSLEPGEVEFKPPEIGDDFIPFALSDTESVPREGSGWMRQRDKLPEREWDVGKPPRAGENGGRGGKRRYDVVLDDEDDRAYESRRPYTTKKTPWISSVDWDSCKNVSELLQSEVEAYVKYMSPTSTEDEIRGLVIQLVSNAITSKFPDARVLPFGSYETKLYLPSGDIDLVIDSNTMAHSNKVNVLHALANTLKRAGITSKVTVISKAKVPIVKFVTHYGRLNVDISINQGNGVQAGKIINGFLKDMQGCGFALRSLILIAKAFLNQRGMNEVYTGGLGSYSIVCLAINFLQMHPKIRRGEIEPEKNVGVLVMEFFELYGCYFNYEEVGISVRNGGSYFSKRQRGWYDSSRGLLLSIEDPTDPSNDISRGSYGINKVRQTFAGAYEIMQATAFLRAGILSSRREGRSHRLRLVTNPEDLSILSSILGVTQETINNRRLLEEVYEKRVLHKLLDILPQVPVVIADVPNDADANDKSSVQGGRGDELELESDDGDDRHEVVEEVNPDESGRYSIQEHRHTGQANGTGRFDPLTIYVTDEDLSADEVEDEAYRSDSAGPDDEVKARRRSYWLSKGIGDDDSDVVSL